MLDMFSTVILTLSKNLKAFKDTLKRCNLKLIDEFNMEFSDFLFAA